MDRDEQTEEFSNNLLFTERTWKDNFVFMFDEKRLYAAKNVLAMVSPVFEKMFGSSFKERDQEELTMPGKNFDDFHEFLKCVYPTSTRRVTKDNVFVVLPLADEYQVSSLKKKCAKCMFFCLKENGDQMCKAEVLKCYSMANTYGLEGIGELCVREMCQRSEVKLSEDDVRHVDKNTLLQYHNDLFAHFSKVHADICTKYVKSRITISSKVEEAETISGFENAIGATLEHTIANVLDLSENEPQFSRKIPIWNVHFQIKTFVANETDKYLVFFLVCVFPERETGWTCQVNARTLLTVSGGGTKKQVASYNMSHNFTQQKFEWGFTRFKKISALLQEGFNSIVDEKSVKIIVHLLANKPIQE